MTAIGDPTKVHRPLGEERLDFELLFASTPSPLLALRPDAPRFTVAAVSDAYLREANIRREQLLGQSVFELFQGSSATSNGADRQDLLASLERVLRTRAPEVMGIRRHGAERWFRSINSPVFLPDGTVAYVIHQLDEVTSCVRAQESHDDWLSMVANDFSQPLNAMLGYAQLLASMSAEQGARANNYFEQMRRASSLLMHMISDLRDVSRLNARRTMIDSKEISLQATARRAIDRHPELAHRCHIVVERDSGLLAWADSDRVEQVLSNLLTNAAKYSEPGTLISIAITADETTARVTVEDQGSGIPLEHQERIFSRFDRGSKARVSGATGLGVGLHLARGLIEAQGGRLWVESTPGSGTRFHFTLPRSPQAVVQAASIRSPLDR